MRLLGFFFRRLRFAVLAGTLLSFTAHSGFAEETLTPFEEAVKFWDSQNYTKAFELWKAEADKGVVEAIYNVGYMYEKGVGMYPKPDPNESLKYYRLAAEQGSLTAQRRLGWYLIENATTAAESDEGLKWAAAAEKNEPRVTDFNDNLGEANFSLPFAFLSILKPVLLGENEGTWLIGATVSRYQLLFNFEPPFDGVLRKAYTFQDYIEISSLYPTTVPEIIELMKIDSQKGFKALQLATKRDPTSGYVFKLGPIVKEPRDPDKEKWVYPSPQHLQYLADLGSSSAIVVQANRYLNTTYSILTSEGPFDINDKARKLYEKAAAMGNSQAMYYLALIQDVEDGGDGWFETLIKAAELGNEDAQLTLVGYYAFSREWVDPEKAYYWASRLSENGNGEATTLMALMSLYGYGTEFNIREAQRLMGKAASMGHLMSLSLLLGNFHLDLGELGRGYFYSHLEEVGEKNNEVALAFLCILNFSGTKRNSKIPTSIEEIKNIGAAKKWCRKSYELGSTDGLASFGFMNMLENPDEPKEGLFSLFKAGADDETIISISQKMGLSFDEETLKKFREKFDKEFLDWEPPRPDLSNKGSEIFFDRAEMLRIFKDNPPLNTPQN